MNSHFHTKGWTPRFALRGFRELGNGLYVKDSVQDT